MRYAGARECLPLPGAWMGRVALPPFTPPDELSWGSKKEAGGGAAQRELLPCTCLPGLVGDGSHVKVGGEPLTSTGIKGRGHSEHTVKDNILSFPHRDLAAAASGLNCVR